MIEPIGPGRMDILMAHNSMLTAKFGNIDSKKDKSTFDDYYIDFAEAVLKGKDLEEYRRNKKGKKGTNPSEWLAKFKKSVKK